MAYNSMTVTTDVIQASKSIADELNLVTERFIIYLPLIFTIFGFIGFIGNVFTYLQPELRSNICCIYLVCGSIVDLHLLPPYLGAKFKIFITWSALSALCKLNSFLLSFLPHLSTIFYSWLPLIDLLVHVALHHLYFDSINSKWYHL